MTKFDFQSIWVPQECFENTYKTKWIGNNVNISISISHNILKKPIFFCNSDPHHLIACFIKFLESIAPQSQAKLKNSFLDTEATIKMKLDNVSKKLNRRHNRRKQMSQDVCES